MEGMALNLETVTPLFLGGADPSGAPELRAASVRGALRFWLRALLGGVIGDDRQLLPDLRPAESAVFGSTDSASPVVVRVHHPYALRTVPFSELTEWDNRTRNYGKPGIAYLFFAARGTSTEPERHAIEAGTSFNLELLLRPGARIADAFKQAYAALWLLTHLGGIGARSRRGAGSLQVTGVIEAHNSLSGFPHLEVRSDTPKRLQEELGQGLKQLKGILTRTTGANPTITLPSAFDVLHPGACKIWVVDKAFESWKEALDSIGQQMQRFRNRRLPDYQNVKNAVQGQPLTQPVQRAAFGLPIVFFFRSLYNQYKQKGMNEKQARHSATGILEAREHDRRASPLFIRATRLTNGKYALVLTLFEAKLLEDGEGLKLKRQGSEAFVKAPDVSLINTFIGDITQNIAHCLEVAPW
ncbi:MAG: hypothetical protein KatS3mg081_1641 [Gemmatimonadales bacterium]|nr:MAG: hypothetical protein KatS3mg081_1641 [Gemmatimonadales bacterium]